MTRGRDDFVTHLVREDHEEGGDAITGYRREGAGTRSNAGVFGHDFETSCLDQREGSGSCRGADSR
jgi:hypothetical protein